MSRPAGTDHRVCFVTRSQTSASVPSDGNADTGTSPFEPAPVSLSSMVVNATIRVVFYFLALVRHSHEWHLLMPAVAFINAGRMPALPVVLINVGRIPALPVALIR